MLTYLLVKKTRLKLMNKLSCNFLCRLALNQGIIGSFSMGIHFSIDIDEILCLDRYFTNQEVFKFW